jgi:AcrR family transcriptional regulator
MEPWRRERLIHTFVRTHSRVRAQAPDGAVKEDDGVSTRDTKQRILDAAERRFAAEGFDGTSLRAVTADADVNLAAVNYHFGSKAALLEAVVGRILGPATERQLARLDELEARGDEPTVEELLEAFAGPIFDTFDPGGERGPVLGQLFGRIMGDPGQEMRRMILALVVHADRRFQEAFARVLTHLSPAERWWRFRSTVALAVSHHVHQAQLAEIAQVIDLPPEAGAAGREERLAWMIAFLSGALRAPATRCLCAETSTAAVAEPSTATVTRPAVIADPA